MNPVKKQIKLFPGTAKMIARACGTTADAVRAWRRVPIEYVATVEALLGIPRAKIRPDVYGAKLKIYAAYIYRAPKRTKRYGAINYHDAFLPMRTIPYSKLGHYRGHR